MASTVTYGSISPLTPKQKLKESPAPSYPVQTSDEGGNSGAAAGITNNNGKVPDSYYGQASPGAGTGVKPTVVNATQGAVLQDDLNAVNGEASTGGTYASLGYSYSSTKFGPPPVTPSIVTPAGQVSGATSGLVPAYASGTTYNMGDIVAGTTAGTAPFYQSIVASNHANTPASSPTKWQTVGPEALIQGPGGGWGYSIANPALLPLWLTGTAYTEGQVVGYVSVNSSYYVAAAYASGTTYAAGTFVIGTDNGVYLSLQASNVGNDPTLSANQGVYWDRTYTTWSNGSNYIVGKQVLLDGTLYLCISAVTSNLPSADSTDWTASTVVNPWAVGTTYAANAIVEWEDSLYISLQSTNLAQIPGTQTGTGTGVGWWAKLNAAPFDDSVTYPVGSYVTQVAATTGVTTVYTNGNIVVGQNPRVNNNNQIDSDSSQDNLPTTPLWAPVGYGVVCPFICIIAGSAHLPDAENQYIGTADWNYLIGGVMANPTSPIAGEAQLGRSAIAYPPLSYAEGSEYTDWNMGSYFGPAATDSPTLRTDYSTIVATVVVNLPAEFAHTTTGYGTVTVKDNNGNLLTPGERGISPLVVTSATTGNMTVSAVEDGTFLITGVAAGTSVITANVGNTRSGSATMTLS